MAGIFRLVNPAQSMTKEIAQELINAGNANWDVLPDEPNLMTLERLRAKWATATAARRKRNLSEKWDPATWGLRPHTGTQPNLGKLALTFRGPLPT